MDGSSEFVCNKCDKKFIQKQFLIKHQNDNRSCHPFCSTCGEIFSNNDQFEQHDRVTHKESIGEKSSVNPNPPKINHVKNGKIINYYRLYVHSYLFSVSYTHLTLPTNREV